MCNKLILQMSIFTLILEIARSHNKVTDNLPASQFLQVCLQKHVSTNRAAKVIYTQCAQYA